MYLAAMRDQSRATSEGDPTGPILDARGLRTLFLDLLGRPPLAHEREAWLGGDSAALVEQIMAREEFWQNWLEEQLYFFLLIDNFRPTTEGVRSLPGLLAENAVGVREALHRICLSSSFDRRNPGPDTFVSVVMEQLLGLTVQRLPRELEIGKKLYDGSPGHFLGRPGSSQAEVIHIAIADPRALQHYLTREHERLLRVTPDSSALAGWSEGLERDPLCLREILRSWVLSDAYERRLGTRASQSNRLFVRSLFVDLFERLPGDAESHRLRSALDGLADSAPLRSLVARLLLDSGKLPLPERASISDPGAWIEGLFERLLGRSPGPSERAAFLDAFRDPACRPATVLYAIVSHPQYQEW